MRKVLLVVVVLCIGVYAQSQVLTQKLDSIRIKYNVVGMSVSVVKGAEVVYTKGFGLRDVGLNKVMTDSTKYRIASISKSISAIALMTLYDKGLFSLKDDVSKHLGFTLRNPSFPNDTITVGMVLSHTASLRDGAGYDGFLSASYNVNPPPAISQLLVPGGGYYSSDVFSSAKGPKDSYFQYSNINYGVIGTLVEKISGKRFDQYCKEVIFDKLGMQASYNVADFASVDNIAALYRKSGSSWAVQADGFAGVKPAPRDLSSYTIGANGLIFAPQGGLRISSTDLAKVMSLLINKGVVNGVRILSEQTTTLMLTPLWNYSSGNGNNYYGIFNSYGTGISKTTELLSGEEMFGHPGEAYGLISDSYFSVKGNYGIVFITNGGQWGYGNYSGWYNVEEDVYKACLAELKNLPISVETEPSVVSSFEILSNYPNPFNPGTTIEYIIKEEGTVKISLFNTIGQLVYSESVFQQSGKNSHLIQVDNLVSGTYLATVESAGQTRSHKILLLK